MFKTNYKKKMEKLIVSKTSEVELLEKLTLNYKENPLHSDEKAEFVMTMIAEMSKEIIACQAETEFTKDIYMKHKNKFKEIVKKKEGEYYGEKKEK